MDFMKRYSDYFESINAKAGDDLEARPTKAQKGAASNSSTQAAERLEDKLYKEINDLRELLDKAEKQCKDKERVIAAKNDRIKELESTCANDR